MLSAMDTLADFGISVGVVKFCCILIRPVINDAGIQFVTKGQDDAGNIPDMFCLLAETVIPELVDDEIFR